MAKQLSAIASPRPDLFRWFKCGVAIAALMLLSVPSASAGSPCGYSSTMSHEAVSAFANDPASILRRHAEKDDGLAEEAQGIMMSGQPGRFSLLSAARSGSAIQQEQIGRGIGRAYRRCLRTNKSAAEEILDGMLRSDVSRLNVAFQAEVDVLWTERTLPQLSQERSTEEIGTSPSGAFGSEVPATNLTARGGPYELPALAGPLPNPFDPIR